MPLSLWRMRRASLFARRDGVAAALHLCGPRWMGSRTPERAASLVQGDDHWRRASKGTAGLRVLGVAGQWVPARTDADVKRPAGTRLARSDRPHGRKRPTAFLRAIVSGGF